MRDTLMLSLILILSLIFTYIYVPNASAISPGNYVSHGGKITASYYYFDYLFIVNTSSISEEVFGTPVNYSDGSLNQTIRYLRLGGNIALNNSSLIYDSFNGSYSYVAALVNQSWINYTSDVLAMLKDPNSFPYSSSELPSYILKAYVGEPADIVVKVVKKDFEEWLKSFFGLTPGDMSRSSLAARAAYFIYRSGYITYNASAVPRSLDYVVTHHSGDCDDMSRVLLNLLWAYGIPGKIEYSLVYLSNFTMTSLQSFGSRVKFVNTGPHAYVVTYVPQLGWVSLDLLAGARLFFPSIVLGSNEEAVVTEAESQEARESLLKQKFAEEVMIYSKSNVPQELLDALESNKTALTNALYTEAEPLIASVLSGQRCIENLSIAKTVIKTIPLTVTETETETMTVTETETLPQSSTSSRAITYTITSLMTKTQVTPITYIHTLIINSTKTVSVTSVKTVTQLETQAVREYTGGNRGLDIAIISVLAIALVVSIATSLRKAKS